MCAYTSTQPLQGRFITVANKRFYVKMPWEISANMTAKIILNPYAGRWKGLQKRGEIEEVMKSLGFDFELGND